MFEEQTDLSGVSATENKAIQPLAARLRPQSLNDFVGQSHLLGPGKPLRQLFEAGQLVNVLLWGPPGCGKTTLAHLFAQRLAAQIHCLSAVDSGSKAVRSVVEQARERHRAGLRTLLFLDEVHRFNKAQQDLFLPCVEDGSLCFLGATTENPSFSVNNALLSRVQVFSLHQLSAEELAPVLKLALEDRSRGLGAAGLSIEEKAQDLLLGSCGGDARRLLNWLEHCANTAVHQKKSVIDLPSVQSLLTEQVGVAFDRQGDHFYDQISALHKAVRGSSVDAALYWLARMLTGGADPLYVARRLLRMAVEDIGNADPQALQVAINGWEMQSRLGQPEGELALAQVVVYLATAPKSAAVYQAYKAAMRLAKKTGHATVPNHLRNAPTQLMSELGAGLDYRYAHDYPNGFVPGESYWPESVPEQSLYQPVTRGFEREIQKRLQWFERANENSDWHRYAKSNPEPEQS